MNLSIGTLVKEKEGRRFGGLIVETEQFKERQYVVVQWSDGTRLKYKSTFLNIIE